MQHRRKVSRVQYHLQERTTDMDGLNAPRGGNGPSPKRQRTQVVEGQICPTHIDDSREDLADNGTKRLATADPAPEAETEGGPQLTQNEGLNNMTETVKAGMFMIQSRTQAADARVIVLHTMFETEIVLHCSSTLCSSSIMIMIVHVPRMHNADKLKACANSLPFAL